MENYFYNFATNEVKNGFLYACCYLDLLPALEVTVMDKWREIIEVWNHSGEEKQQLPSSNIVIENL